MDNKTLAVLALVPLWLSFIMGALSIEASEGVYILIGAWMFAFITWACVRLYKIPVAQ